MSQSMEDHHFQALRAAWGSTALQPEFTGRRVEQKQGSEGASHNKGYNSHPILLIKGLYWELTFPFLELSQSYQFRPNLSYGIGNTHFFPIKKPPDLHTCLFTQALAYAVSPLFPFYPCFCGWTQNMHLQVGLTSTNSPTTFNISDMIMYSTAEQTLSSSSYSVSKIWIKRHPRKHQVKALYRQKACQLSPLNVHSS